MPNSARIALVLAMVALSGTSLASEASATWLFFQRTPISGESEADCFRVAGTLVRSSLFKNPKISRIDAAGELVPRDFNGVFVSITCVGQGPAGVMVLSIAAGDGNINPDAVRKASERVNQEMVLGFGPMSAPKK